MTSIASEMKRPVLWTPGDWNAFFGFGTNILVNMLVLSGPFAFRAEDAGLASSSAASFRRSGLMMCLSTMLLRLYGLPLGTQDR